MDNHSSSFDVIIIGGGIVGTATAMALLSSHDISLSLIEAEDRLAAHQTGNNSGVIHSGLYYKPGSLKALNCVDGREKLYNFCREQDIPHERCGKVVVAVTEDEIPALDELERRGNENGLQNLKRLSPAEIKEYEPHVAGIDGLFVAETGIVNYTDVTNAYARIIQEAGGVIKTGCRFTGIKQSGSDLTITTDKGSFTTKMLVNCGGLYSDRIARMCGLKPGVKIIPFRGEYYEINENKHNLVNNLIYPVPDPKFPFLGVHYTRMIKGGVEAGPNAVLAFKREGYKKTSFSFRDVTELFTYGGFWKMALKYYRMGFSEYHRSLSKKKFVQSLQKLIPDITGDDIHPGGAGVRAQALAANGKLLDDFRIEETENMVHVLNAPSPAATASISIGEKIAGLTAKKLL